MTPVERSYLRGVEVADRLMARGVPILGEQGSHDGGIVTLRLDRGVDKPEAKIALAIDTKIMTWDAACRTALRLEPVHE